MTDETTKQDNPPKVDECPFCAKYQQALKDIDNQGRAVGSAQAGMCADIARRALTT